VRRARSRLRRQGLSGLLRRGHLTVRAEGLGPGRVSLGLRRRARERDVLTLAAGSRRLNGSSAVVRSRVTRRARGALRRARRMEVRVRAGYRARGGRSAVRALSFGVRR
jgi:hypothetical protein